MGALGDRVADTGDPAAAVPFVKQSVRLQRELVEEERPGASVPALAEYLLNYAARLADAGETVAAVPQAEEAVELLRASPRRIRTPSCPGSPRLSTRSATIARP